MSDRLYSRHSKGLGSFLNREMMLVKHWEAIWWANGGMKWWGWLLASCYCSSGVPDLTNSTASSAHIPGISVKNHRAVF